MNSSKNIVDIITTRIKALGISEKKCLNDCGIALNFLSDWRAGRRDKPSYDKIAVLAEYLDIDLYFLFYGERKPYISEFSETELRLLEGFRKLDDIDKGEILGEIKCKNLLKNK